MACPAEPQIQYVTMNCAPRKTASMREIDELKRLLITQRRTVVIFGEGNFTFTFALACLRRSYRGIIPTTVALMDPERHDPFQFSYTVKLLTIESCIENGKQFMDSSEEILGRVEGLLQLPPGELPSLTLILRQIQLCIDDGRRFKVDPYTTLESVKTIVHMSITSTLTVTLLFMIESCITEGRRGPDATLRNVETLLDGQLPPDKFPSERSLLHTIESCIASGPGDDPAATLEEVRTHFPTMRLLSDPPPPQRVLFGVDATNTNVRVKGRVVWFQCPWISLRSRARGINTATLVRNFLTHMESKQSPGDYLLIGIVNQFPYVTEYGLGELLGVNLSQQYVGQYRFLGADTTLVREILQHGYRHQAIKDIHGQVLHDHVTLVFQKQTILLD